MLLSRCTGNLAGDDAPGRLIEKVASGTTTPYYLDGVRIVEETEGTGSPTVERQYAYGVGIDDVLVVFAKDGATYDVYYYLSSRRSFGYFGGVGKDPLWTVEALANETRRGRRPNAAIVEAYAYEVYGKPTIKTGDGGDCGRLRPTALSAGHRP